MGIGFPHVKFPLKYSPLKINVFKIMKYPNIIYLYAHIIFANSGMRNDI